MNLKNDLGEINMIKEEYEKIVTEIIANAGMARSDMMTAISIARTADFDEVERLCKEADEYLTQAHIAIDSAIAKQEVRGNPTDVTLLMVHAQDHLMTAITVKELASELIKEIQFRVLGETRRNEGHSGFEDEAGKSTGYLLIRSPVNELF